MKTAQEVLALIGFPSPKTPEEQAKFDDLVRIAGPEIVEMHALKVRQEDIAAAVLAKAKAFPSEREGK